jgi:hypothetical protein
MKHMFFHPRLVADFFPLLAAVGLSSICGCATLQKQSPYGGTWKMRDVAPASYYLRIYSNGWVAQWPNPVGNTAWSRINGNTLAWRYLPPLKQPTLTRRGPLLIMHDNVSDRVFDKVSDFDPPPTDTSSPADF